MADRGPSGPLSEVWRARRAFRIGRRESTWEDVWSFARSSGTWKPFESGVREGILLRDGGQIAPPEQVKADADLFRRERRLLAAEDAEAWLAARELTLAAWQDHLERTVLRRHHPAPRSRRSVSGAPEVLASGWCSGAFDEMASALAVDILGVDRWQPTEVEVAQLVERRRLDWIRVEAQVATFGNADAAREGLQCVVSDGMDLLEVAALAKAAYRRWDGLLEDLPPEARARLLPAVPGDAVGPVPEGDGAAVYVIDSKALPTPTDASIEARARHVLKAAAVERALAEGVRWHEPG